MIILATGVYQAKPLINYSWFSIIYLFCDKSHAQPYSVSPSNGMYLSLLVGASFVQTPTRAAEPKLGP